MKKIILVVVCILILSGCASIQWSGDPLEEIITPEEMTESLDFIADSVLHAHPDCINGFPESFSEALMDARDESVKPMTFDRFYMNTRRLLASLHDAHTTVEIPEKVLERYPTIDMPVSWIAEGLIVSRDTDLLKRGDRIVSINGISEEVLFAAMDEVISNENPYFIKGRAPELLVRGDYLRYLTDSTEEVFMISVKRDGTVMELPLALEYRDRDDDARHWIGCDINRELSLGYFYFNTCIYDKEFTITLDKFMRLVDRDNIENVVLDLRNNIGGDGTVIYAFLNYLDTGKFDSMGMDLRTSEELFSVMPFLKMKGTKNFIASFGVNVETEVWSMPGEVSEAILTQRISKKYRDIDPDLLFSGNFYLLTGSRTFSSANMFATIVKDNEIGTIIGEPTGNELNFHGMLVELDIPNTPFIVTIAAAKNYRPDVLMENENALVPDITVETTIGDIKYGKDPQMEKILKEILSKE